MMSTLYNDYPTWLRQKYGEKVYKVPVGLNLTCPNRDGTCGRGGCSFCGEIGAGYERDAGSIGQQIRARIKHIAVKHNARLFIPYFLNFSNTYMPPDRFRIYIEAAAAACCANENDTLDADSFVNRKIVAVYIATRPDCIAKEYLEAMADVRKKYGVDICIELGLQSVNYHTLTEINRGHGLAEFIDAVMQIKAYGFQICAHLILNLPGDNDADAMEAARFLSALRIDQVKLHSLFIVKGTPMAEAYTTGKFQIISCEEYIDRAILFLEYLSPDIVVQRLIGRAQQENTLFSNWGKPFFTIRDEILEKMERKGSYQGKHFDYLGGKAVKHFFWV